MSTTKKIAATALAAALIPGILGFASTASAHDQVAPKTKLMVEMIDAVGEKFQATLECSPVGGNHPNDLAACSILKLHEIDEINPFEPVPADAMCGMSSRPGHATVTGIWAGKEINAEFSGRNTCEQSRWDRLSSLLDINE